MQTERADGISPAGALEDMTEWGRGAAKVNKPRNTRAVRLSLICSHPFAQVISLGTAVTHWDVCLFMTWSLQSLLLSSGVSYFLFLLTESFLRNLYP